MVTREKAMISAKIDHRLKELLDVYAGELNVSKSWILQQALRQYFDRYDEHLSDLREARLKFVVTWFDRFLKELLLAFKR